PSEPNRCHLVLTLVVLQKTGPVHGIDLGRSPGPLHFGGLLSLNLPIGGANVRPGVLGPGLIMVVIVVGVLSERILLRWTAAAEMQHSGTPQMGTIAERLKLQRRNRSLPWGL